MFLKLLRKKCWNRALNEEKSPCLKHPCQFYQKNLRSSLVTWLCDSLIPLTIYFSDSGVKTAAKILGIPSWETPSLGESHTSGEIKWKNL